MLCRFVSQTNYTYIEIIDCYNTTNMTVHIMCLTSSGGIPLFIRKKGDGDLMTFSKMASLNGVHMFLKTHNVELLDTDVPDTSIVWKEFKNCITLIAIASGTTKRVINKLLEATFNAMVLIVGLKDIEQPRNVERLKRDLRVCYPIIDKLLECVDISDRSGSKTDLVDFTNCIMCCENHLLQICLESYMESLESMYGCILVHDCIAVATESWWLLEPMERKLLILAAETFNKTNTKNLPVFLPYKSPNLAHRLVSINLLNNVQALALCGPSPELAEIEKLAAHCWKNFADALRVTEQCYPRNFSSAISLDSGILGFLLVNHKIGKFILSRNSHHLKNHVSGTHRLDMLKTFYHHAAETFLLPVINEQSNKNLDTEHQSTRGAKETYWCSEYHKCHALKDAEQIICVLYTSTVPTHVMRLITQKTLKTLLSDKQSCW